MVGFTFINIDLKAAFCNENQTVDGAITEIKISNLSFGFSKKTKCHFPDVFPKIKVEMSVSEVTQSHDNKFQSL